MGNRRVEGWTDGQMGAKEGKQERRHQVRMCVMADLCVATFISQVLLLCILEILVLSYNQSTTAIATLK